MKVIVIAIDGQVIDNSLLLLYYLVQFLLDYSHQFNLYQKYLLIHIDNNFWSIIYHVNTMVCISSLDAHSVYINYAHTKHTSMCFHWANILLRVSQH